MAGPHFLLLILSALCSGTRAHKCSLSKQTQFCSGTTLYAFNDTVGECTLRKSLCPETSNTFSSLHDCKAHCIESGVPAQCLLPKLAGPCNGLFHRFYYKSTSGACEEFAYGGCGNNANNFETLEECEKVCIVTTKSTNQFREVTVASTDGNHTISDTIATNSTSEFRALGSTVNATADKRKLNPTNKRKAIGLLSNTSRPASSILADGFKVKPTVFPSNTSKPTSSSPADRYRVSPIGLPSNASRHTSSILVDGYKVDPTALPSNASSPTSYLINDDDDDDDKTKAPIDAANITSDAVKPSSARNTSVGSSEIKPRGKLMTIDDASTLYGEEKYRFNSTHENGDTDPMNVCILPSERGPCDLDSIRYYYSQESKKCRLFVFGGCNGNKNNFETIEECVSRCEPERCTQPTQIGSCNQQFKRYSYVPKANSCLPFIYSGCGGNSNNFPSFMSCQNACGTQKHNQTLDKGMAYSVCEFEPEEKDCARSPRRHHFYYNSSAGRCLEFEIGKCGSDGGNNFHSLDECKKTCGANICQLPRLPASCNAMTNGKFYYDMETDTCKYFGEGICGANQNSFPGRRHCESRCVKDFCHLTNDSGMCLAYFPKYYYNFEDRQCHTFIYGGCGGNQNRFDTIKACRQRCQPNKGNSNSSFQNDGHTTEVHEDANPSGSCTLPPDSGPCLASYRRYYYNSALGKCTTFIYGGCQGNANNFITMKHCKDACLDDSPNVCSLAPDTGPCRGSHHRYYYNSTLGKCTTFIYGGCQGNANNFINMKHCRGACLDDSANVCSIAPDTGPCRGSHHRYYYNSTLGKCTTFIYGGCQGNANNFITMKHCREACLDDSLKVCSLAPDTGPCRGSHHRYYYNSTLGKCTTFIYGGCQGNANNFINMKHCREACLDDSANVCSLAPDTGPCRGSHHRYYYNSTLGKCTTFIYGGCQGNANNFITMKHCREACLDDSANVCSLAPDTGPCRGSHHRYYYNSTLGKCTTFIYGGCQGNANNFITMKHCREACLDDPCDQPPKVGPCKARVPRFYFNSMTGKCEHFHYGGCDANGNNFQTIEMCREQCARDPCSLRPDVGTCNQTHMYFYFDLALGRCLDFTYSGCGGNANRFSSVKQCRQTCIQNRCEKEMDSGGCDKNLTRFFYDSKRGQCVSFLYGGCGGNTNNFPSAKICEDACHNENPCLQPKMSGPCGAMFKRFYYDSVGGKCLEFDFGGCQGNKNNFHSLLKCQSTCERKKSIRKCHLPKVRGHCSSSEQRFYYNSTLESCEAFTYNGCAGNANNFLSESQCERECKYDSCKQPMIIGNCSRNDRRWYFDETMQLCRAFNYSGCGRNENNFQSLENCEQQCVEPTCRLEMAAGSCNQSLPRFYYNWKHGRCYRFNYTGCYGNENRFLTMKHCQEACSVDPCLQPLSNIGHCRAGTRKYFYNRRIGFCQSFTFRGCHTNGNSFSSVVECHKSCQHMYEIDRRK